jgi:1,4-alpha-glucan branching enzyme
MAELARRYRGTTDAAVRRALNQMARELLLAQSSDWAFMIRMGTAVEYAERRTRDHLAAFTRLYESVRSGAIDLELVERREAQSPIFPRLDFEVFVRDDL